MPESSRYRVLMLGKLAADALYHPGVGDIEAVFRSTFYIRLGTRLICLGSDTLIPGPINCAVSVPDTTNWLACGLARKTPVQVSPGTISINGHRPVDFDFDSIWEPVVPQPDLSPSNFRRGVEGFRQSIAGRSNMDGFGYFSDLPDPSTLSAYAYGVAEQPLADARRWLTGNLGKDQSGHSHDLDWVSRLTGLGMGLTPTGDDFLGGMMIALNRLDERLLCQRLWNSVRIWADRNSNPISLAHLSAASEGYCIAIIHDLVTAILQGALNDIHSRMDNLDSVGHSSGWDTMLGVIFTLEAWLGNQADQ